MSAGIRLNSGLRPPRTGLQLPCRLHKLAAESGNGSSTFPVRALILREPASIDANEITDKGYINQRAVLERRAALVENMYADPPAAEVVVASR